MRYALWIFALTGATGLAAACSSGSPAPAPEAEAPEETAKVTQAFALTPECAQCSADATAGVCGQAAEQCLQDPNCANVAACVQACPPNDPMCLATCYSQASQVLDVLAECVVCQECPVECAGAWQCGGGGGAGGTAGAGGMGGAGGNSSAGVCDNQGVCQACLACAVQGPCQAIIDACLQDPLCVTNPQQLGAAFECAACTECANDCANQAPPIPGLSCPP